MREKVTIMKTKQDYIDAIHELNVLPAMRETAQQILALPLNTEQGEKELLALIEYDPQLTAKIIGLSNSPVVGANKPVTSLADAAKLLGLERVKSIAMSVAIITSLTRQPKGRNLDINYLWVHSLLTAMSMSTLSRAMPEARRPSETEVFVVGLLHDIGFLVLDQIDAAICDVLLQRMQDHPDRTVEDLEAELLPIGHSELGAELAAYWNLPAAMVEAMRHNHASLVHDIPNPELLGVLILAEKLLPQFGHAHDVLENVCEADWRELEIDPARAESLAAAIAEHAKQAGAIASALAL